jgi:hypothetical protein
LVNDALMVNPETLEAEMRALVQEILYEAKARAGGVLPTRQLFEITDNGYVGKRVSDAGASIAISSGDTPRGRQARDLFSRTPGGARYSISAPILVSQLAARVSARADWEIDEGAWAEQWPQLVQLVEVGKVADDVRRQSDRRAANPAPLGHPDDDRRVQPPRSRLPACGDQQALLPLETRPEGGRIYYAGTTERKSGGFGDFDHSRIRE